MKFLCDVHIPYKLLKYLKHQGCEAFHVNQLFSDPRTSDNNITRYADEHDLIIITKDIDFEKSFLLKRTPKRLIRLNVGNSSTAQILNLFERNWTLLAKVASQEAFFIESDTIHFYLISR